MAERAAGSSARIMRIALPISLIRDMDALILRGDAGYETRAEFIVDAIQERLIELSGAAEIDAGAPSLTRAETEIEHAAGLPQRLASHARRDPSRQSKIDLPSLPVIERGYVLDDPEDNAATGALFGLHNRDYPSLWALSRLAAMAAEQPVPLDKYYGQVLQEAWDHGRLLAEHEGRTGIKSTALFPTNNDKKQSAEAAFRMFAVGECRETADQLISNGPLFQWRVAGVRRHHDSLHVAVTGAGWDLLAGVAGVSVLPPHQKQSALTFLEHLRRHAADDLQGFYAVVRGTGEEGASRTQLLEYIAATWPEWTKNEISTNASGYLARAREWGLVEPIQVSGMYLLTPFGQELLEQTELGGTDA
jgi:hypothetical protein